MAGEHDKDLDEDLELDEGEEGDDEDDASDADVAKGKKPKSEDEDAEAEAAAAEAETDEEDANEDGVGESAEDKAAKEALRARRRREKKLKRERERRERMQLQNTVVTLQNEIKQIREGGGQIQNTIQQITDQQIQTEMNELGNAYKTAQAAMEKAITENDGAAFTAAKNISDKAWARYNTLELAKKQRQQYAQQQKQQTTQQTQKGVELGDSGRRYGIEWARKHSEWYDPSGSNLDSRIVQAIDADLYNEGFDPESKDYWDELTDRVRDRFPHRFRNQAATTKKKPPQIVGGGAGSNDSSTGSIEKTLPKELIVTIKAAGMWDDKKLRNAAIKDYMRNRKRSA